MKEDKERLLKNVKMKCRIEKIKQDNEILDNVKENVFEIYNLELKFIVRRYSKLSQIIENSNCSNDEKFELHKYINNAHSKVMQEKKNLYSAMLE